jgi:uncharacterized protein (TIGR02270 family)
VVQVVLEQHAEELAILWNTRRSLATSGHVALRQLARCDERIAAHQHGCAVAGAAGIETLRRSLADLDASSMFGAMLVALELHDFTALECLLSIGDSVPEVIDGAAAALGWASSLRLAGVVGGLLRAASWQRRGLGLAACQAHGVDPRRAVDAALRDDTAALRARALIAIGELGKRDLLRAARSAMDDEDASCKLWAARSAVLLGDRGAALELLASCCHRGGSLRLESIGVAVRAMTVSAAGDLLHLIAQTPEDIRWLTRGTGIAGDPLYIPWLIKQMETLELARLAGESFSMITGLDLAYLDLERKPPEDFEPGPNDDPNDPNVDMDPDEGLPWPDPKKIAAWWDANKHRFQSGVRYFMGAPPTREHCIQVLKNGYQRQRIAAAQYLCLLNPGTLLFNTSAPAWRQKRLLDRMQ